METAERTAQALASASWRCLVESHVAMGTTFEVRVWWREDQQQLAPIAALWSELQRCEEALSDYLSTSEARRLVDRRSWTPVGEVLAEALQWGGACTKPRAESSIPRWGL